MPCSKGTRVDTGSNKQKTRLMPRFLFSGAWPVGDGTGWLTRQLSAEKRQQRLPMALGGSFVVGRRVS